MAELLWQPFMLNQIYGLREAMAENLQKRHTLLRDVAERIACCFFLCLNLSILSFMNPSQHASQSLQTRMEEGIFKHCSVAEIKGIKEKHSRNIEAGLCSLVLAPCLFHVFPLTVHICRKPWMIWRMRSRLSVAGNPVHNLIPTFPQTEIENVFETFFGTQSVLLKTFIQFGVVF